MAEKGDSSEEEPTIAEDVVVTKYKMAGDMANRKEWVTSSTDVYYYNRTAVVVRAGWRQ